MQFTDIEYAFFLPIVFILYWFLLRRHLIQRNLLLLSASYVFYGWWDWRFLILIIITTCTTYLSGLFTNGRRGKLIVTLNIVINLGILFSFKYLGFFAENLQKLFSLFGWNLDWFTIKVLLPVGISFYTFQAIGYTVDVYRKKIKPCTDPIAFATFIAYFPQLVAGPIERAGDLLPQLQTIRQWKWDNAVSGLRMILFGVLKKVAVADVLSIYVDQFYGRWGLSNPIIVLLAGILFSFQLYFDFSAYAEIARGSSRLLGIELMANFKFPYFSRNVVEFWRRWHISLMKWFRDYVYIPLGGSRKGSFKTYINISIVFLLSGLWHGAGWNFIIWGCYWAVVYLGAKILFKRKVPENKIQFNDLSKIIITFFVVAYGFLIFRCLNVEQVQICLINAPVYVIVALILWIISKAITSNIIKNLVSNPILKLSLIATVTGCLICAAIVCLIFVFYLNWEKCLHLYFILPATFVMLIEWKNRNQEYPFYLQNKNKLLRWGIYWICMLFIILSEPIDMNFIYFQF